MKILITGCAGFIGYHLTQRIIKNKKFKIYGIDNLNSYYDINLKKERLKLIKSKNKNFKFFKLDISNKKNVIHNFKKNKYDIVINLAAQAGVRYSIDNPQVYFDTNIEGFFNLLQASTENKIKHFIFASTSSVYGNNKKFPLEENFNTDNPLSFYAASKKCNEVMAYSYSNIFHLPCTALRFFTVYGPLGRPDMALYKFTNNIINNKKIELFNYGNHFRDFTYIDDLTRYVEKIIIKIPKNKIPYEVYNIASGKPKSLKYFVNLIEKTLQKKAKIKYLPKQKGDVHKTHAKISKIKSKVESQKSTDIKDGIKKFINWYKSI